MYSLISFFTRVEFYTSENDYRMQKGRACPYMVCHARRTVTRCSVQTNVYLLLTDVPCIVSIHNKVYTLAYSESLTGNLFLTSNNGPYMSLCNSLTELFSNCQRNYNCCLLTIGINTVAVIKNSEQSFKIFDAHSRDLHGMPHSFGKCTLLTIEGIENLVSYL